LRSSAPPPVLPSRRSRRPHAIPIRTTLALTPIWAPASWSASSINYALEWGKGTAPVDPNSPSPRIEGWPRTPGTIPPLAYSEWPTGATASVGVSRSTRQRARGLRLKLLRRFHAIGLCDRQDGQQRAGLGDVFPAAANAERENARRGEGRIGGEPARLGAFGPQVFLIRAAMAPRGPSRSKMWRTACNLIDCVELRWGAPEVSDEASTCKRHAPGAQRAKMTDYRAWFHERRRPPRA